MQLLSDSHIFGSQTFDHLRIYFNFQGQFRVVKSHVTLIIAHPIKSIHKNVIFKPLPKIDDLSLIMSLSVLSQKVERLVLQKQQIKSEKQYMTSPCGCFARKVEKEEDRTGIITKIYKHA